MSEPVSSKGGSPLRKLTGVQIVGTGSFLPEQVVTNEDLKSLGSDPEWLIKRTGIRQRRHAPPEMATSDMAVQAAEQAIGTSGVRVDQIDLLILATLSPDHLLPATATAVQDRLDLNCAAMDLSAACAGFTYALITGMQFVATGCSERALVIGSDTNSRILDPNDKATFPLFGDGAGAVVLAPGGVQQGAISYTLGADGSGVDLLYRRTGGSRQVFDQASGDNGSWYLTMDGRGVFKWAVRLVEQSARDVLSHVEMDIPDVDWWLPHQANVRILDAATDSMGIDRQRVIQHLERYGNTSAGSIPIALDESVRAGTICRGDQVMMMGFGAGLAWGTILFRW